MKTILFCFSFNISDNRPYSVRALTIAKIYRKLGYRIVFLCIDSSLNSKKDLSKLKYCNFDCYILHFYKTRNPLKIFKASCLFKKLFSKAIDTIKFDYGTIDIFLTIMNYDLMEENCFKYSKKHKIPLIYTSSEWYQYKSFYGRFIPLKYLSAVYMRNCKLRKKNVIAISRFLRDFYEKQHCHVALLPSIVDEKDYLHSTQIHKNTEKIRIMYAGYPGKKDVLKSFLKALCKSAPSIQEKIDFYGYGFYEKDVIKMGISQDELRKTPCIHICGQVSQDEIRKALSISDFSILLRENTLNAKGGFSTKIVESMMAGVPLIANLTGDMELYFNDSNSVILSNASFEECEKALKKIILLSSDELYSLKQNAYKTALESFNYKNYLQVIQQFMEELK